MSALASFQKKTAQGSPLGGADKAVFANHISL